MTMKKTILAFLGSALLFASPLLHGAGSYELDNVHSSVIFKIKHNDLSYYFGRFNDYSADIRWAENPADSRFRFTIQAASVDTHNERRDNHLRSNDFFSARQHPEIQFASREVKKTGDNTYEITGDLTLLGETKPITFTWKETGAGEGPRGDHRRGGITTFTIKRSDFGMNYMLNRLSDEVEMTVSLQMIRQ